MAKELVFHVIDKDEVLPEEGRLVLLAFEPTCIRQIKERNDLPFEDLQYLIGTLDFASDGFGRRFPTVWRIAKPIIPAEEKAFGVDLSACLNLLVPHSWAYLMDEPISRSSRI